ncbi:MAG TPA: RDD family protein [Flavobacterium sp.]|uniref:RDD family protein n=1 Tax=Flavobacterium sp. TaxID=239 RepID=UPI002BC5EAAA|nr:RDD family protein [Flavobacterium sp.]HSD14757.1 RDD family protein [Flavobacterium sp.]
MTKENPTFKFKTNFKKRIFATIFDYGIFFLVFYTYILLFGHETEEGNQAVSGLLALPVPIIWFVYFVIVESSYGGTIGHQFFDLKVLTLNRRKIDFTDALKRHLLDPIDIFFYGIPAIIAIKNSDKHQRLGDMWAKTFVVDTTDNEQYLDK